MGTAEGERCSGLYQPFNRPLTSFERPHTHPHTQPSKNNPSGPAMLSVVVPLLSKLPLVPAGEFRPCLYAAENDHKVGMVDRKVGRVERVEVR